MRWIDLTPHHARLQVADFGNKHLCVVLVTDGGPAHERAAKELGFKKLPNHNIWTRDGAKVLPKDFQAFFPQLRIREMQKEEVRRVISFDGALGELNGIEAFDADNVDTVIRAAIQNKQKIGVNHLGHTVYEDSLGRCLLLQGATEMPRENDPRFPPAAFLRARTPGDLMLCADGFVQEIGSGKRMLPEDVRTFAKAVLDQDLALESPEIASVETALRAAVARKLSNVIGGSTAETFRESERYTNNMRFGLYAMPFTLAASVVNAVGKVPSEIMMVSDPAGAMTAFLPRTTALRLVADRNSDRDRVLSVAAARDVRVRDSGEGSWQRPVSLAITCPAARALQSPIKHGAITFTREDTLAAYEAVSRRDPMGRSVHVFEPENDAGEVAKTINKIAQSNLVHSIAEIDPSVYGGTPGGAPYRVVIVGGSHEHVGQTPELPEPELLVTANAIWVWSCTAAEKFSAGNSDTDELQYEGGTGENTVPNDFQVPYAPASRLGVSDAMVPRNLDAPMRKALSKVVARVGDIDAYVCEKLQFTKEELAARLGPDQIDSTALGLVAAERGRGFLIADQTGRGKGRQIAARIRVALLEGKQVIFCTNETNLYVDLWRDLRALGIDGMVKPFALNASLKFVDGTADVPIVPTSLREQASFQRTGLLPKDVNMVFATYAQFNRKNSARANWLVSAAKSSNVLLVLDESHIAAGESNIADNIERLVDSASEVLYSSATHLREAKNIRVYKRILPHSRRSNTKTFVETIRAGGEPLQEAVTGMLVEDGVYVRREADLSRTKFELVIDIKRSERNRHYLNALAPVLSAMSFLAGDVDRVVGAMKEDARRVLGEAVDDLEARGLRRPNDQFAKAAFGQHLHRIHKLFTTALKLDVAADMAVSALASENQRKPVLSVDATMESVLAELQNQLTELPPEDVADLPRDFRLVLLRAIDSIMGIDNTAAMDFARAAIKSRDDGQNEEGAKFVLSTEMMDALAHTFQDLERATAIVAPQDGAADLPADEEGDDADVEEPARPAAGRNRRARGADRNGLSWRGITAAALSDDLRIARDNLRAMIMQFPATLSLSPLDVLSNKLKQYKVEEITGRSLSLTGDGMVVDRIPTPTIEAVDRFNAGVSDAALLGRTGQNGISMHASPDFADQKAREMILVDQPDDIVAFLQKLGRVDRRGQVCSPSVKMLSTGLPYEVRLQALHNRRLARFSANITSNRDHHAISADTPDIFNEVGDMTAREYLDSNPALAARLGIDIDVEDETEKARIRTHWHINMLMSRFLCLSADEQDAVWDELLEGYRTNLSDLDLRGENPLAAKVLPGVSRIVNKTLFEGVERGNLESAFDAPVYLINCERDVFVKPMRATEVEQHIDAALQRMGAKTPAAAADRLEKERHNILRSHLVRTRFRTVEEALAERPPAPPAPAQPVPENDAAQNPEAPTQPVNEIQSISRRIDKIIDMARRIQPGCMVTVPYYGLLGYAAKPSVVLDIKIPSPERLEYAGAWTITIIRPGEEKPRAISFHSLLEDATFNDNKNGFSIGQGLYGDGGEKIRTEFDEPEEGVKTIRFSALHGNLFRATEIARSRNVGFSASIRDRYNVLYRVMHLRQDGLRNLEQIPVRSNNPDMLMEYMTRFRGSINAFGAPDNNSALQAYFSTGRIFAQELDDIRMNKAERKTAADKIRESDDDVFVVRLPSRHLSTERFQQSSRIEEWREKIGIGPNKRFLVFPKSETRSVLEALTDAGAPLQFEGRFREWSNQWLEEQSTIVDTSKTGIAAELFKDSEDPTVRAKVVHA